MAVGGVIASHHYNLTVAAVMGRGLTAEPSVVTLDVDPMWWKLDVDTMSAPSNALSIQGAICTTAYFGPLDVVKPQPGDTVLASEAAGAAVRQIAKIHAFRTVGIAVTPERARQLTEEFGFDAAFDYNGCSLAELTSADKEACPEGVEIPFDNVGGMKLDAALTRMNLRGRIATRGLISQYDGQTRPAMHNLFQVASSALLIEGFLVRVLTDRADEAIAALGGWVREGRLVFREDIVEGLDELGAGFAHLFFGSNEGKLMVNL